ncbi:hypothetical protein [Micropruina sp.]|uniref:hypothetical protein n=1 Tax=Micropruina sp. TaxID=2737536 RepID=UPI0039E46900
MKVNLGSLGTVEVDPDEVEDVDLDREEYRLDGERLTEARAAEVAREISRRNGARGGRPPLSAEGTERIGLRIPKDLRAQLRERATTDRESESEVARKALAAYLGAA